MSKSLTGMQTGHSQLSEMLVLVDADDNEIGVEEKLTAHRAGGMLHRAFSVFIYNSDGQLMLQRRAGTKYHSGGLWSNTCCGHPRPGESTTDAARRRLAEEMGFDTELNEKLTMTYKVPLDHDLTEWEYLHIFTGQYDGEPTPDPEEASDWLWVDSGQLFKRVTASPADFTKWFTLILPMIGVK